MILRIILLALTYHLNYMCMFGKIVVVIYTSKVMFVLLIEKDIPNVMVVLTLCTNLVNKDRK